MTFSTRDQVRLLIGDTDSTAPLIFDDEVDTILAARTILDSTGGTTGVNVNAAAADCAGAIVAKYARKFNFTEDGQTFQVAQVVGQYTALERDLRARSGGSSAQLSIAGTATT